MQPAGNRSVVIQRMFGLGGMVYPFQGVTQ
jgi:hypothetical protein